MKRQQLFSVCIILLLSSCLAEQTNPLIIGSCTDGIQNQNEEAIDCGGICTLCEVIEPVVVPCEASLTDNVLSFYNGDWTLSDDDYDCSEELENFELYVLKNDKELIVRIYETTLPMKSTIYPIQPWWLMEPGSATIRLTDSFNYSANTGELYLSYKNNKWIVEICSVNLIGTYGNREVSGRVICDW